MGIGFGTIQMYTPMLCFCTIVLCFLPETIRTCLASKMMLNGMYMCSGRVRRLLLQLLGSRAFCTTGLFGIEFDKPPMFAHVFESVDLVRHDSFITKPQM